MAKTRVNLNALKKLIDGIPKEAALASNRAIAQLIEKKMKDLIKKGISPIEGDGRFPPYKAQVERNKKKYPDSVRDKFPNKRRRPVNLFLSGRFLRELKAVPRRINLIVVGFFSPYGQKLEQGHREQANGQGYRPIIPDTQAGEDFALSIKADILRAYRESILAYLKKNK